MKWGLLFPASCWIWTWDAALVGREAFLALTTVEETHRPVIPLIRHSVSSDAGSHTSPPPTTTPHSLILTHSRFYFFTFIYLFFISGLFTSLIHLLPRGGRPLLSAEMDRWEAEKKETRGSGAGAPHWSFGSVRLKPGQRTDGDLSSDWLRPCIWFSCSHSNGL